MPDTEVVTIPVWSYGVATNQPAQLYAAWHAWWLTQGQSPEALAVLVAFVRLHPLQPDSEGRTLLHAAAQQSAPSPVLQALISSDAIDPLKTDSQGNTAWSYCSEIEECAYLAMLASTAPKVAQRVFEWQPFKENFDIEAVKIQLSAGERTRTGFFEMALAK